MEDEVKYEGKLGELMYKPTQVLKTFDVLGEVMAGVVMSPNVFVIATSDTIENRSNITISDENLTYYLDNIHIHKQYHDRQNKICYWVEVQKWIEMVK